MHSAFSNVYVSDAFFFQLEMKKKEIYLCNKTDYLK